MTHPHESDSLPWYRRYELRLGLVLILLGLTLIPRTTRSCEADCEGALCWIFAIIVGLAVLIGGYLVAGDITRIGHHHRHSKSGR